jgi:uncharacterized delta-60 repeat protein
MSTKNVLFIDSRVTNYQSIIDGLTEPAEVFILNSASDGLRQMADDLKGRTGIDAIHVISHGSSGALYLGGTVLNSANLDAYGWQLASIGSALTPTGDILLYGCNVAQGDLGLQFITSLSQETGADVAASDNATGADFLGGDFVLEREVGVIEATQLEGPESVELLAVTKIVNGYGKLKSEFGGKISSVAVLSTGKILVAGTIGPYTDSNFALARYNADGSLDSTFGSNGKVTTDFSLSISDVGYTGAASNDYAHSITEQSDGKIIVSGTGDAKFAVARYDTTGSLDKSFNNDGKLTTPFGVGGYGEGKSVILLENGKILVAGTSSIQFAIARYNPDGSLDNSFSEDGKFDTYLGGIFSGESSALQVDGKALIVGYTYTRTFSWVTVSYVYTYSFAVARFNVNGSLDTSFDTDGLVTTYLGKANCVAVQSDGKILVAGDSNSDFGLVRYNSNGSLDTSFDGDGKVTLDFGSGPYSYVYDTIYTIALQIDGKILVGGSSSGNFALARYNVDGRLDITFDGDGRLTTDFGGDDTALSINLQPDGRILVGGSSGSDFVMARYNLDGSLDTSFGVPDDSTPPIVTGFSPTDGATEISADSNIVVTFSEAIKRGSGSIILKTAAGSVVATYDSISSSNLIFAGSTLTINPNADLAYKTGYSLVFSAGAVKDLSNNNCDEKLGYDFTTAGYVNNLPVGSVNIIGISSQGQAWTATNTLADLDGLGTISYQWSAAGVVINGATSNKFALTQAQVGKAITVAASYTDGHGTVETVSSNPSLSIANVNDLPTGAVTITGTPTQGQSLTVANTLVDLDGLGTISYQWNAGGTAINGATASTFLLTEAQVGKIITVVASYTDVLNTAESKTSSPTTAVANVNDLPTGSVTIIGTATQGQTLTASNTLADLDGIGTISYQWSAAGVAISGATSNTFILTAAQVGKTVTGAVSYTDGHGTLETVSSTATTTVTAVNISGPVVLKFDPADESKGLSVGANISVTFNEAIKWGSGYITLKDSSGATVATYDAATSTNLTISGNTLTINPSKDLGIFTGYKVEIGAGAIKDLAGNNYAGVSDYNFTTATVDSLYHFFVVAFNAAPGKEYMNQLAQAYNYPLTVKEIVNIFTTKAQFTDTYPVSLSHQELATSLVANIVKNSATAQAKQEAISDIKGALDIGWTVGDMIFTVFGNLANKSLTDPTWGGTAQQFINETAVARYYTEVMGAGGTDLPTLRAVIASVDNYTDVSTPAVIATLIGVELAGVH